MKTYSRVSQKLRRQILDAVSHGIFQTMNEKLPFVQEGGPDTWDADQTEKLDLLTEAESQIATRIEKTLLKGFKP